MHNEVWYKLECLQIERAVTNVYQKLGRAQSIHDYQDELSLEFDKLGIPFARQNAVEVAEQKAKLDDFYSAHFICHKVIAVKIKVLPSTHYEHTNRVSNYLRKSNHRLGLLANFGCQPRATVEKINP